MSVKDRWVGPCEQVLNVLISIVVSGRETRWGPMDRSTGVLGMLSGAMFLGSSDSIQDCWQLAKGCYM
jgi:hypothetical protein